jgi:hypothetical protein
MAEIPTDRQIERLLDRIATIDKEAANRYAATFEIFYNDGATRLDLVRDIREHLADARRWGYVYRR